MSASTSGPWAVKDSAGIFHVVRNTVLDKAVRWLGFKLPPRFACRDNAPVYVSSLFRLWEILPERHCQKRGCKRRWPSAARRARQQEEFNRTHGVYRDGKFVPPSREGSK